MYTHTLKYYLASKKEETLPFATTSLDLYDIMLSEISQIHIISLMCGIKKGNKNVKLTVNRG